jgi:hypothetical protein
MSDSVIDCDAGRQLGCDTFCCRLIVRYYEDERPPSVDGSTAKGCVDKAPDGLCIHLDRATHRCSIWEKRPRVCREYSCNDDYLLQVAVRVGVKNIVQLSRDALREHILREDWIRVPACSCGCSNESTTEEEKHG